MLRNICSYLMKHFMVEKNFLNWFQLMIIEVRPSIEENENN